MRSSLRSPSQVEETQGFLPQLEKDLEIHPSTRLEVRFPCRDSRAISYSPSQLEWRLDFPGATREAPCFPHRKSRETPQFAPQLEKNHVIPLSSRDEARLFLQDLESNPEFPLKTRQEASVPLGHSMGFKRYSWQLKRRVEFFASTRD